MSPLAIGILGLAVFFLLMAMGMPVAFAMALAGFGGFVFICGIDKAVGMVGLVPHTTAASYLFSVIPLFLLMGEFCTHSGIIRDAYRSTYKWLGHLPGGLAMATIGGCAGFSAVCGSSVATAATMTRTALPEMLKYKYDPGLATGCLAAGGTLGILIPPSLGFILYGLIAEQSVGRLFLAGIFPGILLSLLFMLTIYIIAKRSRTMGPAGARASWRQRLAVVKDVWGLLILFLLVMGGIWGGIFTPTEAAAIGCLFAFILILSRRQLTRQNMIASFMGTIMTTGMCLATLIGAMIFGYSMSVSTLPTELASLVTTLPIPPMGILVSIIIIWFFLGCIMSTLQVILLTTPIFLPVILALGFNPIWFGVIVTIMSEMGMITPPVGVNVYVVCGMAKDIPMHTIFRGIWPFVGSMAVCIAILTAFPQISLFLPNTMMAVK